MRRHLRVLLILALTQITGWGTVGVLPVIAPPVAASFGSDLPSIFLGTSVMFVAMGLAAPWAGRAFRRFGAQSAMVAGAAGIGLGAGAARAVAEPGGLGWPGRWSVWQVPCS